MNFNFKLLILTFLLLILIGCNDTGTIVVKKEYLETTSKDFNKASVNINTKTITKEETTIKTVTKEIKKPKAELKVAKKCKVNPKKENFKKIMVPIIQEVYRELETKYNNIKQDIKLNRNTKEIQKLKKQYKAKNKTLLLHAIKPHPVSIVLAQSAVESAWLDSRFAKEANNIFGVWSFDKNEPRIAASGLRGKKTIYLKKYDSYKEAVRDYYKSIGKSWAYKKLRHLRTVTDDPKMLLPHLEKYSEKGEEYIDLLKILIRTNHFEAYDIKKDI